MFRKILIANRGEIALRVIRTCREMGIKTVAVHSTADAESLHVRLADESVCIGKGPSKDSYLNIPAILSAAEITDAEAIHPGYGFLSENAHFAEVCASCKIVFIGPKPEVIRALGDKVAARETMRKAGVPMLPGTPDPVKDAEEAVRLARDIKYPVIIKASAGGGGRGMRVAHTDVSLRSAFMTTQREAEAAFGNPEVYMEKYLEDPRHVEVQLLGDSHGNVMHLGERDCSSQRRHQKLIEESPCPVLHPKTREALGKAAVNGAKAAGYTNAGTMEFLLDSENKFYFMEVNTRVQVEHPVTEQVMGLDIVAEQIRVAAGLPLTYAKKVLQPRGHAIECRVNAEDPWQGFRPSPGRINHLHLPGGLGVRVDTHIYEGYVVPPHYDSMLAKLIVHGRNRTEAVARMLRALDEFVVEGIATTIPFLKRVFADKRFQESRYGTHFIEAFLKEIERETPGSKGESS